MSFIDPAGAREFLEALVAAFAVLGGLMAYFSGFAARRAQANEETPPTMAHQITKASLKDSNPGLQLQLPRSLSWGGHGDSFCPHVKQWLYRQLRDLGTRMRRGVLLRRATDHSDPRSLDHWNDPL